MSVRPRLKRLRKVIQVESDEEEAEVQPTEKQSRTRTKRARATEPGSPTQISKNISTRILKRVVLPWKLIRLWGNFMIHISSVEDPYSKTHLQLRRRQQ